MLKKILILFILLISTALPQSNWFWFYDSGIVADTTPPDSVENLVATARAGYSRHGYVDLSWDAVTDASMYYVYRGTSTNPTTLVDSTASTSYTDSLASNLYFYRVKAGDASYNLSSYSVNVSDTVYEFEFFRYSAALTTALSDSIKWKINTHIKNVKDDFEIDSLSQQFKVILYLANATSEAALKNLVERDNDATLVNAPSFTAHQGFLTAATGQKHINTNFNPGTADSLGYNRMSCSQGVYVRTTNVFSNTYDCGATNNYLAGAMADSSILSRQNTASSLTYTSTKLTSSGGFTIGTRTSHTNAAIYRNYTLSNSSSSNASAAFNAFPFAIGGSYYSAVPEITAMSDRQYAYWFVGLGMTDAQVSSYTAEVERTLDEDGAGVVAYDYYRTSDSEYYVSSDNQKIRIK